MGQLRAKSAVRFVWFGAGLVCLLLAAIGAVLPLLPTTVFVLMAAFCFGRSSPRFEAYLLNHQTFGPIIRDWRAYGAIAPKYKKIATGVMALTLGLSVVLHAPGFVLVIQAVCLGGAATYVLTRPNGPRSA